MTDIREQVERLARKFMSQVGDDIQEIYSHEALFKIGATTLRALLSRVEAAEKAYVEQFDKREAAEAERDAAVAAAWDRAQAIMSNGDDVSIPLHEPWFVYRYKDLCREAADATDALDRVKEEARAGERERCAKIADAERDRWKAAMEKSIMSDAILRNGSRANVAESIAATIRGGK